MSVRFCLRPWTFCSLLVSLLLAGGCKSPGSSPAGRERRAELEAQ